MLHELTSSKCYFSTFLICLFAVDSLFFVPWALFGVFQNCRQRWNPDCAEARLCIEGEDNCSYWWFERLRCNCQCSRLLAPVSCLWLFCLAMQSNVQFIVWEIWESVVKDLAVCTNWGLSEGWNRYWDVCCVLSSSVELIVEELLIWFELFGWSTVGCHPRQFARVVEL